MDFEQKYYDALYTIKKLKEKNQLLEQENQIYKSLLKKDKLKLIIGKELVHFLSLKDELLYPILKKNMRRGENKK